MALKLEVRRSFGGGGMGRLKAGPTVLPCALGPAGVTHRKREGDRATPAGRYGLAAVFYRPDRIPRPRSALPVIALRPEDGWCDDVRSTRYNRRVRRPFAASHEELWRDDGLYDCLVVIRYNTDRIRRGQGSAIFLHVAAPGFRPTAGCVALRRGALVALLRRIGPDTVISIG